MRDDAPTILAAEDDAAMRRLLERTPEDDGHEVVAFADELAARRWLANHRGDRAPLSHATGGSGGVSSGAARGALAAPLH